MKKRIATGQNPVRQQYQGAVGVFKHWLPRTGNYNLEEYMWLFKWIQDKKIKNINPFWARVALVKDENNTETLKSRYQG